MVTILINYKIISQWCENVKEIKLHLNYIKNTNSVCF